MPVQAKNVHSEYQTAFQKNKKKWDSPKDQFPQMLQ